ncbi:hypothetical protein HH214_18945 [Mucilaginibacter robiniae]|uniref:MalT-like TPR region domain-containing protein n=1 Tax=Mucilaginibacter robiniae TaxID=2728022 RepID=A0A7L5E3Y7_9SPHI|nr:hypothetical protein [Mucilaginibacter robiniae]QJD97805.1 hypothetical protein HH214_18945 [Mucilaginibacter robiniae]
MKRLFVLSIILLSFTSRIFANGLDSLKQQLQITTIDSAKAAIYTRMVDYYLDENNSPNRYSKRINAENAVNYSMLALHLYSKNDDTTGLKTSYTNLSKAYRMQRLYAQAKWFILQANALARQQTKVDDIIGTLVQLAAIKMDIHDYKLANRDLKEALRWSLHYDSLQVNDIKRSYTRLYTYISVPTEENIFIEGNNLLKISGSEMPISSKSTISKRRKVVVSKRKFYAVNNKETYTSNTISF